MSDVVKALLEELNLERSVPLRDVWAAIEQHKANLATIESLESHNAKLVEELDRLRADLAQLSEEMGLPPGIRWAPGVLKRWLDDFESARALFASGQCVDLAKVNPSDLKAWLIEKAGVKL